MKTQALLPHAEIAVVHLLIRYCESVDTVTLTVFNMFKIKGGVTEVFYI